MKNKQIDHTFFHVPLISTFYFCPRKALETLFVRQRKKYFNQKKSYKLCTI